MFDNELTLIEKSYEENELGDSIEKDIKTVVWCSVESVTRSEHYAAASHGLSPEMVFLVNQYEYEGQKEVEFAGKRYKVIRAYQPRKSKGIDTFETIELICEGV
jgi:SPP1 family predicted phage head-tail adaptor